MIKLGAHIIYDESGATSDSNILCVSRDYKAPLILGNHILTKHYFENSHEDATYRDLFMNSLLERMELLYSRGITK